jgi:hypothetical protein
MIRGRRAVGCKDEGAQRTCQTTPDEPHEDTPIVWLGR